MDKKRAEHICTLADEILDRMQALNSYVNQNCQEAEIKRIRPALAVCVTEIDLEILEPIYREHPELKPPTLP